MYTLTSTCMERYSAAAGEKTENLIVHSHLCVECDSAAAGEEADNFSVHSYSEWSATVLPPVKKQNFSVQCTLLPQSGARQCCHR